jgi:hypothetical protein
MSDGAVAQPLQNWPLGRLSLIQQGVIDVTSLLGFRLQVGGLAQISLVSEHNEKFCLLSIGCLFHYPWRNLGRNSGSVRWRTGVTRKGARLSGSCRTKRKEDKHDSREAKQKAKQNAEVKERRLGHGFLFHWMKIGMNDG